MAMGEQLVRSYSGEERTVFYRSRLEVRPSSQDGVEVWPLIVGTLQGWLEEKEESNARKKLPNLLTEITQGIENYTQICPTTPCCYLQTDFALGHFDQACGESHIVTKVHTGTGSTYVPQFWAMEYMERDHNEETCWYRRWCTNVGVTALENGGYAVNVGVYILDDASCLVSAPAIPPRTIPRFIQKMLDIPGCTITSDGIPLTDKPLAIGVRGFDRFVGILTNKTRSIPLLVISAEEGTGHYLLDPVDCAKSLRGAAVVCTLNLNDPNLLAKHVGTFRSKEASYKYGVPFGFARVFLPGVNLENRQDYRKHRFYSANQLRESNTKLLVNDVCGAITRLSRRRPGEVIDLRGIRERRELESRQALSARLEHMRSELEKGRALIQQQAATPTQDATELKKALEDRDAQIARYNEQEQFYLEYISNLEATSDSNAQNADEYEETQQLYSMAIEENTALIQRNQQLEDDNRRLTTYNTELASTNESLRRNAQDAHQQRTALENIERFPKTPVESLYLARDAFGARLAFLPEAESSAKTCTADAVEVWDILRCMNKTLWPLYFEEVTEGGTIPQQFLNATGYELAMTESSTTRADTRLQRLRKRMYKEQEVDVSAHVKGRSGNRDALLRVHFFIDREDELIVIGHCGSHLETAGTRYVH